MKHPLVILALVGAFLAGGCTGAESPTLPEGPVATGMTALSGLDQHFPAGRRSPEPFRVRAVDAQGGAVPGLIVEFRLSGAAGGRLSQPTALTDQQGIAESYLLDASPGVGTVEATSGPNAVAFPVTVHRAPGEMRFVPGSGEVGIPGLTHPDSVLAVDVLDTDGAPMEGVTVWFAAAGALSSFADTTDSAGRASVTLGRSNLGAGAGAVYAFIVGFEELAASGSRPVAAIARRVVLVSVEGLRADAVQPSTTPALSAAAAAGAQLKATTVLPSLSVPAHLSLWAGVSPETHGVLNDTLRFTPQMATLDPVFKRAGNRGFPTAAWLSEEGPLSGFGELLSCRAAFGLDSLALVSSNGRASVDGALTSLADPDLALVFVHVPDPDSAGHAFGFTSPEYHAAVSRADAALADLIAGIDPATTLLIVTSPHGGGGSFGDRLHGSNDPADVEVPLIFYGPGIDTGTLGHGSILDVAPTVLWALGMAPPAGYEGRVLLEIFHTKQ